MILSSTNEILHLAAWFLALAELILALYILLLNFWHSSNRHVGALLLVFAANTFALGQLIISTNVSQARVPILTLSATTAAFQPLLLIVAVALLKPDWLPTKGRSGWRRLWLPLYLLAITPLLLTLVDAFLGTSLWFTGLDPSTYSGGYAPRADYADGSLSAPIKVLDFYLLPFLTLIPILYIAWRDKTANRMTRQLAWLLLAIQIITIGLQFGLRNLPVDGLGTLIVNAVFVFAYAYTAFQQMISERLAQRGRLQTRLTALVLAISLPLLTMAVGYISTKANEVIKQDADERLEATNQALISNVTVWLDLNIKALEQLVSLPDIVSMDAERQEPVLKAMAAAYPHMYLVSTTNLTGTNLARNDGVDAKDYSDRVWFQDARDGAPLTIQTLIGKTSKAPALVASMPIRNQSGEVIGVGMFASVLTDITDEVKVSTIGNTGFTYVVDSNNKVIAHPDPNVFVSGDEPELPDFSQAEPVIALGQNDSGLIEFAEDDEQWRAYVDRLNNGWGVVVQQQESEVLGTQRVFLRISTLMIGIGAVILSILTSLTIRQSFIPINSLTETAAAIAAGDLTREAPVESEDEIGTLANAFNSMTQRIRELVGSLEQRVADRTLELERRSRNLEASAQVARDTTSVLDPQQLLQRVVSLISERFDYYHTGIFLLDASKEWAVLQAASSEGGQRMLARGHRLRVGHTGIVGYVTSQAKPRIALDVGEDATFFDNPDLPETRSEIALPLRARGEIIGALDVQSTAVNAFGQEDIETLQTLADQVAVAINNAQLFQQAQAVLQAERRAYGEISHDAWQKIFQAEPDLGFYCDESGITKATLTDVQHARTDFPQLDLPIKIANRELGTIRAHKPDGTGEWTDEEIELVQTLADQLGTALENARLYQETQSRALREQLVGEVTTQLRQSLDIQAVLRTAAEQIRQALDLPEVTVRLTPEEVSADQVTSGQNGR